MAEGDFPKIDGDILFASEVNFMARPVQQVYTGTDFNASDIAVGGSGGETINSTELTAIPASKLGSAEYVKITLTLSGSGSSPSFENALTDTSRVKVQIKETGQSYADIFDYKTVTSAIGLSDHPTNTDETVVLVLFSAVTAGMKTNGLQLKVFGKATSQGSTSPTRNGAASITNIQTVVELE